MGQYTLFLNIASAEADSGGWTFDFPIYNSIAAANSCVLINNGTVRSAPCIVTLRASGTFVLTYSSTALYVSSDSPYKLSQTDPD